MSSVIQALLGTQISHSRCATIGEFCYSSVSLALTICTSCASLVKSAVQASRGHSQFALSLRFPSDLFYLCAKRALNIRILVSLPTEFLFKRLAETQISNARRTPLRNSSFQAPCEHSKLAISMSFASELCYSSASRALHIHTIAELPTEFCYSSASRGLTIRILVALP